MEVNIVQELPRQLVTHENFIKYELIVRDSESHHTHTHHTRTILLAEIGKCGNVSFGHCFMLCSQ